MDAEELKKSIIEYLDNTSPNQLGIHIEERIKAFIPYFALILAAIIVIVIFNKNPELSLENIAILLFSTICALVLGLYFKADFDTMDTKYKLIRSFLEDASSEIVNQSNNSGSWITVIFFVTPKQIVIFENRNVRDELRKIIKKLMHYDYLIELKARDKMFIQSALFMTSEIQNILSTTDDTRELIEEKDFEELKKRIAENKVEESFEELYKFIQKDEKRNELILLSSQFRAFRKEVNLGKVSIEDFNIQQNRIAAALLNFIDENKKKPKITEGYN